MDADELGLEAHRPCEEIGKRGYLVRSDSVRASDGKQERQHQDQRLPSHRCTRPDMSPVARRSTSAAETRLKSPGMVCLSALAAIANCSARHGSRPSSVA